MGQDLNDAIGSARLDGSVKEDLEESAQIIVSEVKRCRRITHALLGRAERMGDAHGSRATIADSLKRSLALVFAQNEHQVSVSLGPAGEVEYPFDPMVQIFVNLLQNARDAAPGKPVTVVAEMGDDIEITVADRGDGMNAEAIEHLFEPFFTTKPPGLGTGLGLYTSSALAHSLGGQLTLTNDQQCGVKATLTIPLSGTEPPASSLP